MVSLVVRTVIEWSFGFYRVPLVRKSIATVGSTSKAQYSIVHLEIIAFLLVPIAPRRIIICEENAAGEIISARWHHWPFSGLLAVLGAYVLWLLPDVWQLGGPLLVTGLLVLLYSIVRGWQQFADAQIPSAVTLPALFIPIIGYCGLYAGWHLSEMMVPSSQIVAVIAALSGCCSLYGGYLVARTMRRRFPARSIIGTTI